MGSWVISSWIGVLTILVLSVEVGSGGVADSNEVVNSGEVGEVLVKVILEVLEHVHVLLDEVVSSDSSEGEGGVVQLPGVDLWWLDSELVGNDHNVHVVLLIAFSGELVHLPVELLWVDPESLLTVANLWGKGINDSIILPPLVLDLNGGNGSETEECN